MGSSKKSEEIGQFKRSVLKGISHEFRTPLVAINTGTEVLMDNLSAMDEDQVRQLLESIRRGGQRLQSLIDDFLAFQKIQSGVALSVCQQFRASKSLVEVVLGAIKDFGHLNPKLSDEISIDIDSRELAESAQVDIYEPQVRDLIKRLLSNACKFSKQAGKVRVYFTVSEDSASVHVRDYGCGIQEAQKDQALYEFYQIDRELNEQQGCGLGLSIASHYAKINNGEIFIRKPEDGQGVDVEISFRLHVCKPRPPCG